jgi:transcription antitermination factor NusG
LKSRHEFAVRDLLRAAGIEEFLPTREVTTQWTDRIAKVTRPLFHGYIFIRCVQTDAAQVLRTRGVVQILGVERPEAIPDEVITNLQRLAALPAALAECPYVAGESVVVARGPFAGVAGVISRVQGATSLSIPVEILGRAVSVRIDAADVEATK